MTQDSLHSAAGQALGYVHQCMWALVELGKRANEDPATQLRLEALDDIEFENSGSADEAPHPKWLPDHFAYSRSLAHAQRMDGPSLIRRV